MLDSKLSLHTPAKKNPTKWQPKSKPWQRIYKKAKRFGRQSEPLLITGETGTGKSTLARWIHHHSKRANGPLVVRGAGELSHETLVSTLFGHRQGAFTGATSNHTGLLESAHRGTLIINDIDILRPEDQSRLLGFLDDGTFCPLGGKRQQRVDVRIIATTNRDLKELIRQNLFREDLYYRLNVFHLHTPPLRETPEDTITLAQHLLANQEGPDGKPLLFSENTLKTLSLLTWPGNIRVLEKTVKNLASLADEGQTEIELSSLVTYLREDAGEDIKLHNEKEPEQVRKLLLATGGNKTHTAMLMGHSRTTIHKIIRENGWNP